MAPTTEDLREIREAVHRHAESVGKLAEVVARLADLVKNNTERRDRETDWLRDDIASLKESVGELKVGVASLPSTVMSLSGPVPRVAAIEPTSKKEEGFAITVDGKPQALISDTVFKGIVRWAGVGLAAAGGGMGLLHILHWLLTTPWRL